MLIRVGHRRNTIKLMFAKFSQPSLIFKNLTHCQCFSFTDTFAISLYFHFHIYLLYAYLYVTYLLFMTVLLLVHDDVHIIYFTYL